MHCNFFMGGGGLAIKQGRNSRSKKYDNTMYIFSKISKVFFYALLLSWLIVNVFQGPNILYRDEYFVKKSNRFGFNCLNQGYPKKQAFLKPKCDGFDFKFYFDSISLANLIIKTFFSLTFFYFRSLSILKVMLFGKNVALFWPPQTFRQSGMTYFDTKPFQKASLLCFMKSQEYSG